MTDHASGSTFPVSSAFNTMSDIQLRQTISQLSSFAPPTPQPGHSKSIPSMFLFLIQRSIFAFFEAYMKNLHTWSTTSTPPPKGTPANGRSTRARTARSNLAPSTPTYTPPIYQQPLPILATPNPPRPPLPTTKQALVSTYSSRLRTGATLLMQPILAASSATNTRAATRRGGVINYADPGSGDDLPDAGALDSDDSDFIASGGTRTSIRQTRTRTTATGMISTPNPAPPQQKAELDQSYLGMVPPAKFIKARPMPPTRHVYP